MKRNWYKKYMDVVRGGYSSANEALFNTIKTGFARMSINADTQPKVSVVVIAYNEEQRLIPCLWSLSEIVSKYPVEVIVVDNASTDRTAEIIERCGAKYVLETRKGVGNARQAGMEAAHGDIIVSADADTLYPSRYIDAMVRQLEKKGTSAVFTTYWFMDDGQMSERELRFYSWFRDLAARLRSIKRPELAVGGAAMVFYRADGLSVGWKRDIRRGEDGSMIVGLKDFGHIRLILSREVRVRSTSRTLDSDGSLWQMIFKRIKRETKRLGAYTHKQEHYQDKDYNKL